MTLCEACNCYPCCCGGERKTMEAPEWIWLQCDTPNHMAELLDLSTPPVAGAATAFAQYVALPQYREVAEDRAFLTARVAELEGALDAIERDGTKEHNAAVGLRSQVAQLLNENKFLSRENTSLRAKNCLLKAAARKHALAALGKGE